MVVHRGGEEGWDGWIPWGLHAAQQAPVVVDTGCEPLFRFEAAGFEAGTYSKLIQGYLAYEKTLPP